MDPKATRTGRKAILVLRLVFIVIVLYVLIRIVLKARNLPFGG